MQFGMVSSHKYAMVLIFDDVILIQAKISRGTKRCTQELQINVVWPRITLNAWEFNIMVIVMNSRWKIVMFIMTCTLYFYEKGNQKNIVKRFKVSVFKDPMLVQAQPVMWNCEKGSN